LASPYFTNLFNRSLVAATFRLDTAFITPIVKKAGLDTTDVRSYRPISNLSVVLKLLERIVVRELMAYLLSADLLSTLQTGFRPGFSTETVVLQVMSGLLSIGGFGRISSVRRSTFVAVLSGHSSPVCCAVVYPQPQIRSGAAAVHFVHFRPHPTD